MAKVLVIDDDQSLLRALRLGLKAGGHQVTTATNGEASATSEPLGRPLAYARAPPCASFILRLYIFVSIDPQMIVPDGVRCQGLFHWM